VVLGGEKHMKQAVPRLSWFARFRRGLTKNKIFFETLAAAALTAASITVAYLQLVTSEKQNSLLDKQNSFVDLQARIAEAQALPTFDIRILQVRNDTTGFIDHVLTIDNIGGPVHEFYAREIYLIHIEAATLQIAPIREAKLAFQVQDYYAANAVSAASKGRLLSTVSNNNNERLFEFSRALSAASKQRGWLYANVDEFTYMHLTYKDVLNRFHSGYYSVAPVIGSTLLSDDEGKSIFDSAKQLPRISLSELTLERFGPMIDAKLKLPQSGGH
jgi:hypothetical protein